MLHDWIVFSLPLVEGIMNWYWLLVAMLIVLISVLFGLHYEPDDDDDFMDVYGLPVLGTVVPALMAPGAAAVLLLVLPVWGTVVLTSGVAYGIYKMTKKYKEKN